MSITTIQQLLSQSKLICETIELSLNRTNSDLNNFVKNFLARARPFMKEEELQPSLQRLKSLCDAKNLGEQQIEDLEVFVFRTFIQDPNAKGDPVIMSLDNLRETIICSSLIETITTEKINNTPVEKLGIKTQYSLLKVLEKRGNDVVSLTLNDIRISNITALLDYCPNIQNLSINGLFDGNLLAEQIANHKQAKNIKTLCFTRNCLKNEGALAISRMNNLEHLNVSLNKIEDIGAKALVQIPQLKKLDLRCNKLSDEGCKDIESLWLNLENNQNLVIQL